MSTGIPSKKSTEAKENSISISYNGKLSIDEIFEKSYSMYTKSLTINSDEKADNQLYFGDNLDVLLFLLNSGYKEKININDATNVKLQWKVDWPMRWMIEKVTFETGGIDHSAANGSKSVSERIVKEIFRYK